MRTHLFTFVALFCCSFLATPASAQPKSDPAKEAKDRKGGEVIEVEIAKGVKMTFCWIPAGEAQLGAPKAERMEVLKLIKKAKEKGEWLAFEAEEVRGKFRTKGFWMAKYPVTQEQWKALMGNNPSGFQPSQDPIKKAGITDTALFPVEQVSWNDCKDFLTKMNKSVKVPPAMGKGQFALPHEDEWEYACRGGKGNKQAFYFGNALKGDLANCIGESPYGTAEKGDWLLRTTKVGDYEKKAPHPWGLCDMHGNVWQWCDNKHEKDEDIRIFRGGSWSYGAEYCRSAYRGGLPPGTRVSNGGFRPCFRLD